MTAVGPPPCAMTKVRAIRADTPPTDLQRRVDANRRRDFPKARAGCASALASCRPWIRVMVEMSRDATAGWLRPPRPLSTAPLPDSDKTAKLVAGSETGRV